MVNPQMAEALAGAPNGPPSSAQPSMPQRGGGMPAEQAAQILQQLGITPQNLPIVIQAIQAVMQGGAQPPAQGGPPMMAGPGGMPPNGPPSA